ncbi:MAG TPA: DUF4910 domain-containing protein [Thermoanaerobaculia bacterium]|nr:DUF4910 domain-containing protein [Thermoanaerobaculia bacterium]
MRTTLFFSLLLSASTLTAEPPPLLSDAETHAIVQEISGETAKRNLEEIARHHRMRGSEGFRAVNEHLLERLRSYGIDSVEVLRFPADGEIFYGTQRSRPPWNAEFAELWEVRAGGDVRLASWEVMPMRLAQDSESGEAEAELVDAGAGIAASDYEGKDVRGKFVLASAQPGAVAKIAVERHGAAGILSYAQNQRTAWWGEDETMVRWGHLDTFAKTPAFAFMLSMQEARGFQRRIAAGETIRLRAAVRAGKEPGSYEIVTATIPGADPRLRDEEIIYSCHLDHPRPGANDNASGCAAILEVARTFSRLVGNGKLLSPRRTIRFVWPPEIEGTMALLAGKPEIASRIRAAIHLDMVGGGPETKAIFHVTRGPASLPSFIYDLAQETGRWLNERSAEYAMAGSAEVPLVEKTGGKEALQAALVDLTLGSDHQIYSDSSFGIPAIYLNDWPDRFIHTTHDTVDRIDSTKLRRAAFIAAASGWALATFGEEDTAPMLAILQRNALRRMASLLERRAGLSPEDAGVLTRFHLEQERKLVESIGGFAPRDTAQWEEAERFREGLGRLAGPTFAARRIAPAGAVVYRRNPEVRGPMSVFGYDYLEDHYGREKTRTLRLLGHGSGRGASGADYAYEALNLVDGRRTLQEIRDALTAIYGPVPLELVAEYLAALEEIGVVLRQR